MSACTSLHSPLILQGLFCVESILAIGSFTLCAGTIVAASPKSYILLALLGVITLSSYPAVAIRFQCLQFIEFKVGKQKRNTRSEENNDERNQIHSLISPQQRRHELVTLKEWFNILHDLLIKQCGTLQSYTAIIQFGATILFFTCFICLIIYPDTVPYNFDFGPKYGMANGDRNIAFTLEFNTLGHCIQGILASLSSFPAITGTISRIPHCYKKRTRTNTTIFHQRPNLILLLIMNLLSTTMTIYPVYNLLKRLIKSHQVFAKSSFLNNASEWCIGYVVGLSFGYLISNYIYKYLLMAAVDAATIIMTPTHDEYNVGFFAQGFQASRQQQSESMDESVEEENEQEGVDNETQFQPKEYAFGRIHEYEVIISPIWVQIFTWFSYFIAVVFLIAMALMVIMIILSYGNSL